MDDEVTYKIPGLDLADLDPRYPVTVRLARIEGDDGDDGPVTAYLSVVARDHMSTARDAVLRVRAGDAGEAGRAYAISSAVLAVAEELNAVRLEGEADQEVESVPRYPVKVFGNTSAELEMAAIAEGSKVFGGRELFIDTGYSISRVTGLESRDELNEAAGRRLRAVITVWPVPS